jgi:hypothetical protein
MKAILKFDLETERNELETAINASQYRMAWEDIWGKIFRGRNKHGYNVERINQLLGMDRSESEMTTEQLACNALMDELELIYQSINTELLSRD